MRELPILFNGEMVRAILSGAKVETRRPVKTEHYHGFTDRKPFERASGRRDFVTHSQPYTDLMGEPVWFYGFGNVRWLRSPFGSPGDLLYVRERTRVRSVKAGHASITYEADGSEYVTHVPPRLKPLVPGRCMANGCYKEASRIWLRVLEVRVERVQEITEEGARREGMQWGRLDMTTSPPTESQRRRIFSQTWDSIYAAQDLGWDINPWVSPCRFEVVSTTGKPA